MPRILHNRVKSCDFPTISCNFVGIFDQFLFQILLPRFCIFFILLSIGLKRVSKITKPYKFTILIAILTTMHLTIMCMMWKIMKLWWPSLLTCDYIRYIIKFKKIILNQNRFHFRSIIKRIKINSTFLEWILTRSKV